ncbi:hypothetical protein B6U96_17650 [Archaeoglobales archaeon ex4484_92]|nr:MAG: hypothetical protein B6U96_17650 [Archaeoglobales archaeon ex4484_92]
MGEVVIKVIKVKKKSIARWLDRLSWLGLGWVIGFSQGDWIAWLCYLPIFIIIRYLSIELEMKK